MFKFRVNLHKFQLTQGTTETDGLLMVIGTWGSILLNSRQKLSAASSITNFEEVND